GERYETGGYYDSYPVLFDITNPLAVTKRDPVSPNYSNYAFAAAGNYMIVAAERSGVTFWNVADMAHPQPVGTYVNLPGSYAWSVAVSGNIALVGTSASYLNVIDLSYDNSLSVIGSVQTTTPVGSTTEIRSIAIQDNLAFLANEAAGLKIVDIRSPGFPIVLNGYGVLPAGGSAAAVAANESLVLVADSVNGLLIYDATNVRSWTGGQSRIWPSSPSGGGAYDVKLRGNYAYVARGALGLDIWDISNPYSPIKVGTFIADGFAPIQITLYKKQLYALDGNGKLFVLNLVP
uniref:LVIVD repeat-containing protein n=1 Tax=Gracilinema caldarium TaxID=215591 RepID=UPI0026F33840